MGVTDELAVRREQVAGESGDGDGEGGGDVEEPTGEGQGAGAGDGEQGDAATEETPKPPKLLQEPLPGDWDAISSEFGGAVPTVSEIRLLGGKMPIDGSFQKGAEFDVIVRVRVTGVLGQDLEDAYGTKQHTVRRHQARMISVRRVNQPSRPAEA